MYTLHFVEDEQISINHSNITFIYLYGIISLLLLFLLCLYFITNMCSLLVMLLYTISEGHRSFTGMHVEVNNI